MQTTVREVAVVDRRVPVITARSGDPAMTTAFAHAPLGMAVCSPDGILLQANDALARLLDRPVARLREAALREFIRADDAPVAGALATFAAASAGASSEYGPGEPLRLEAHLLRADGRAVPVQLSASSVPAGGGQAAHLVLVVEDITERKALEKRLVHRSLHDPLTGLPNRTLFEDRLRHALDRGHREGTSTCVLIIDLDEFKAINDQHGHQMGDAVLISFAERLTSVLRASDTAARLGGDEFGVVCENTELAAARVLSSRLRAIVRRPLVLGGTTVALGTSVGIGTAAPGDQPDAVYEQLIRTADDAMYAAKQRSRRRRSTQDRSAQEDATPPGSTRSDPALPTETAGRP